MSFFFSFLFVPGLTSFPSTSAVKDVSSNTRVACSDVGIPFLIPHTRTNIEDLSLPQPNLHRYGPCSLTSPSSCSAMWCRHMVLRLVRDNSNCVLCGFYSKSACSFSVRPQDVQRGLCSNDLHCSISACRLIKSVSCQFWLIESLSMWLPRVSPFQVILSDPSPSGETPFFETWLQTCMPEEGKTLNPDHPCFRPEPGKVESLVTLLNNSSEMKLV